MTIQHNSNTPILTVIVPVYNTHDTLERCLKSLMNQTLIDMEIICIDDGSTDDSLSVMYAFEKKDPRIRLLQHKKNLGLLQARLNGIRNAQGRYIAFLDSDDYVSEDFYRGLIWQAVNSDSDIVAGRIVHVATDGVHYVQNLCECLFPHLLEGPELYRQYWKQQGLCFNWHIVINKIYRKDLFIQSLDFLSELNHHVVMLEDFILSSIVLSFAKKMTTFSFGCYFYTHESGVTSNPGASIEKLQKNISDVGISFEIVKNFLIKTLRYRAVSFYYRSWENRYFRYWSDNIINSNLSEDERKKASNLLCGIFHKKHICPSSHMDNMYYRYTSIWDSGYEDLSNQISNAPAICIDMSVIYEGGLIRKSIANLLVLCAYRKIPIALYNPNEEAIPFKLESQFKLLTGVKAKHLNTLDFQVNEMILLTSKNSVTYPNKINVYLYPEAKETWVSFLAAAQAAGSGNSCDFTLSSPSFLLNAPNKITEILFENPYSTAPAKSCFYKMCIDIEKNARAFDSSKCIEILKWVRLFKNIVKKNDNFYARLLVQEDAKKIKKLFYFVAYDRSLLWRRIITKIHGSHNN